MQAGVFSITVKGSFLTPLNSEECLRNVYFECRCENKLAYGALQKMQEEKINTDNPDVETLKQKPL